MARSLFVGECMSDPDLLHNYQRPTPVLHLSCTKHTLSWLYGYHSNWADSAFLTFCILTKLTHSLILYFYFLHSFTSFSMFTISWNSSSSSILEELAVFCVCSSKWLSWLKGEECNCISATWLSLMPHVICTCRQSAMPCKRLFLFMSVCLCMRTRGVV